MKIVHYLNKLRKKIPFILEVKNVFYLYERHILFNVNALSKSLDNKHLIVIMWKGTQVHIRV